MIHLGILGSTRGTNLTSIIDAIRHKKLAAHIEIVMSNKPEAGILTKAQHADIPTEYVNPEGKTREAFDQEVSAILKKHRVELVVLIGYMRILSDRFVAEWRNKLINVHPSLLPDFAGGMDLAVHQAVLDAGSKETGCTVHYVTEEVDAGPIIVQKRCAVLPGDTAESVKARVQALEGEALIEAIKYLAGKY